MTQNMLWEYVQAYADAMYYAGKYRAQQEIASKLGLHDAYRDQIKQTDLACDRAKHALALRLGVEL